MFADKIDIDQSGQCVEKSPKSVEILWVVMVCGQTRGSQGRIHTSKICQLRCSRTSQYCYLIERVVIKQ